MMMTCGEICASYRQAKHRKKQIGVLADLNCCDRAEIREILEYFGEIESKSKQTHNVRLAEREKELRLALGLSMRQVSKIAGIGKTTLSNFENRLPTSEKTVKAIAKVVKKLERMKTVK
jgi:ABC-type Na+ transport system ATPase subunit NatA